MIVVGATSRVIENVAVAPASSESGEGFRLKNITGYTLYLPTGETIAPDELLTIRGTVGYMVDGELGQWTSPFTGRGKGVEVLVRKFPMDAADRVRPAFVNDNGTLMADYSNATVTPLERVRLEYASSVEDNNHRVSTSTIARLVGPPDIDLVATDRVRVLGSDWEITGATMTMRSPTSSRIESQTPLRLVNG